MQFDSDAAYEAHLMEEAWDAAQEEAAMQEAWERDCCALLVEEQQEAEERAYWRFVVGDTWAYDSEWEALCASQ